jgi:hypothetical protein
MRHCPFGAPRSPQALGTVDHVRGTPFALDLLVSFPQLRGVSRAGSKGASPRTGPRISPSGFAEARLTGAGEPPDAPSSCLRDEPLNGSRAALPFNLTFKADAESSANRTHGARPAGPSPGRHHRTARPLCKPPRQAAPGSSLQPESGPAHLHFSRNHFRTLLSLGQPRRVPKTSNSFTTSTSAPTNFPASNDIPPNIIHTDLSSTSSFY